MPAYEFRCRTCGDAFTVQRSMTEATTAPAACPDGHSDTTRIFSAVAVGGRAGAASAPAMTAPAPAAGGCCGGGCCG